MCDVSYNTGIEKNLQDDLEKKNQSIPCAPIPCMELEGERVKESYKETDNQIGFT